MVLPQTKAGKVVVRFSVTNQSEVEGKSVVQLYVEDLESSLERPQRELKGFKKVNLAGGETQTVTMELDRDAFSFYHPQKGWIAEAGEFNIFVANHSADQTHPVSINLPDVNLITRGIH